MPKPLASAAGRPFLEWVIRYLHGQGLRRIVISSGYQAQQIEAFAGALDIAGLQLECVAEDRPMGTAGGFLNAWAAVADPRTRALVVNGDSLLLANLAALHAALEDERIDGAIQGLSVEDASRNGSLDLGAESLLQGFAEKRPGAGIVNAGVYLLRSATVARFPDAQGPLSFEREVFPALLAQGARLKVVEQQAAFLDIGTEESLAMAGRFISDNMHWFA
jgi:NDP-sugar pyrophosphorylase family protein